MKVDLRLLGGFALASDGEAGRPIRIRSPKGCALIAYLAMQPECRASRERLADLLWGDRLDNRARQNLRQCVVRLRHDLGSLAAEMVMLDHDAVGLRRDCLTVDALQFASHANSADVIKLQKAIALYRGEFLANFHLDVEAFDEWVRSERNRLDALATRLFETFGARASELQMGEAAISAAERLTAIDPLREDWQRLALRLYARHRGRDAALAHARALTAKLKQELNTDPDAATTALIEDIRRGAIAAAPATVVADFERRANGASTDEAGAGPVPSTQEVPPAVESPARAPGRRYPLFRRRFGLSAMSFAAAILIGVLLVRLIPGSNTPASVGGTVQGAAIDSAGLAAMGLYSIAVLPFTATAEDAGPLAERITDDLINDLTRAGSLQVISRQTSDLYRNRPVDIAAVGSQLGARYVVVGSVHSEAARLRINIELVNAATRVQAWTTRIERNKSELPAAADEIAWGITRQLHVGVTMAEERRSTPDPSRDSQLGELLAKGWAIILRHNVTATTAAAEEYFTEVLRRDPDNLSAMIGLGAHYVISVSNLYVRDAEPYLSRADELLTKAIDRNPHSSQAYYFLGILQKTRSQAEAALRSFSTALELSPSNAPASAQVGLVLASLGRANEAMQYIDRAIRLSAQDPALGRWDMFGGQIELELGHAEAAIEWLLRAVTLNPRNARAHAFLAAAYALAGNTTSAVNHALQVKKLAPWAIEESRKLFMGFSGNRSDGQVPRFVQGWQMALVASASEPQNGGLGEVAPPQP